MTAIHFPNIDLSYFTTNTGMGNNTGGPFYDNTTADNFAQGTKVHSLTFWVSPKYMRGCTVELSNGTSTTYGLKQGIQSDTFVFGIDEKLTSLTIYGTNFLGGRCAGVKWTTSTDRSFSCGSITKQYYNCDTGSGYLVGIFGRCGADIDCLGFAVLRTIQKVKLINVKYPNLGILSITKKPKSIKSISYDNSGGSEKQTFTFAGKESVTQSSSWSVKVGVSVTATIEVEGGFPLVSKTKGSLSTQLSVEGSYQLTNTKITDESFSFPISVPAGKIVEGTATLYEANIDTPFTATLRYTLDTGSEISSSTTGTYYGVDLDHVTIAVEETENV